MRSECWPCGIPGLKGVRMSATIPDEVINWLPPGMPTDVGRITDWTSEQLAAMQQWLVLLARQRGFCRESVAELHPTALLARLQAALPPTAAEELSSASTTSSLEITEVSQRSGYDWPTTVAATVRVVQQTMGVRETPLVALAGYQQAQRQFTVATALATPLPTREDGVLQLLAQMTALTGHAHYASADTCPTPLHAVARTVLQIKAAIACIPIYRWTLPRFVSVEPRRHSPDGQPIFQGVCVAVRRPEAPVPSPAQWLHWVLLCQSLHLPLAVVERFGKDPARLVSQCLGSQARPAETCD